MMSKVFKPEEQCVVWMVQRYKVQSTVRCSSCFAATVSQDLEELCGYCSHACPGQHQRRAAVCQ